MENSEQNIELKTQRGHVIVIKPFITGAELESIGDAFIDAREDKALAPSEPMRRSKRRSLEVTVVSVDGKTANIADEVGALPLEDWQQVVDKVNEITAGTKKEQST